jgi:transposase, IS5 family
LRGILSERLISQPCRRVLDGEQVAKCRENLFRSSSPLPDQARQGIRAPAEFGHKVFLTESAKYHPE